jgi:hypothetical protein
MLRSERLASALSRSFNASSIRTPQGISYAIGDSFLANISRTIQEIDAIKQSKRYYMARPLPFICTYVIGRLNYLIRFLFFAPEKASYFRPCLDLRLNSTRLEIGQHSVRHVSADRV